MKTNYVIIFIIVILNIFHCFADDKLELSNGTLIIGTIGTALLGSGLTEYEAKTLAIEDAKRSCIEKAGTYIEAHSEVVNFKLIKDEVITLSAGIIELDIINTKRVLFDSNFAIQVKVVGRVSIASLRERINKYQNDKSLQSQLEIEKARNKQLTEQLREFNKGDMSASSASILVQSTEATQWYDKGYAAFENENYKGAIEYCSKAIQLDLKYTNAYNTRAFSYSALTLIDASIKDFSKAIELGADISVNWYMLGVSFAALNNHEKAIKCFSNAIEKEPTFDYCYYLRAESHEALGDTNNALIDYTSAISLNSQNEKYYFERANLFESLNKIQDAIRDFNLVIELDPVNAAAYGLRGRLFMSLQRYSEAASDFNNYLKIDGNKRGSAESTREAIRRCGFKPLY